jgi:hypothetical protein
MFEPAFARVQAVRNLVQGIGLGELAEEHGDELLPGSETFGAILGFEFADMAGEIGPLKKRKKLAKDTARSNHKISVEVGFAVFDTPTFSAETEIFSLHFTLFWTGV